MSESEKTDTNAEKIEKATKPSRSAKPERPANVVVTELAHGTVLRNAVAVQ